MAPSFANLPDEDDSDSYDEEEEIDYSDLRDQYEVRLEEGLDTFIVIDGLPVVSKEKKAPLTKFLLKKLKVAGRASEESVFMPMSDKGETKGRFAFVEFASPAQVSAAVKALNGTLFDRHHTMLVNKLTDIDRYGRDGRINDEYEPPHIDDYVQKEHLRWFMADTDGANGRDQFVMYRSDDVGVFSNRKTAAPKVLINRANWTDSFMQWSPLGTYLTSVHRQGVLLWGGEKWSRQQRFSHPYVNLVDFSPNENYVTTWSNRPIELDDKTTTLGLEDENKNYIIWNIETGKPLRSFADPPSSQVDESGNPVKRKIQWPAFKWSADDKYVARLIPGHAITVYELPKMNILDKISIKIDGNTERSSVKIEGVVDFEWAPADPQRDGIKTYEQLLCYWTPEIGSNPAKVALMSIPSKEIVRTRNLFNVMDVKLHWQSQAAYLCVKVDRHSKSKKSMATNLEIFRVREKGVPIEVVDSIKDTVINFAWEPKGDRFVLITTAETNTQTAVPPKTSVSFFCPEKSKGLTVGNYKHIRTIDKKNHNGIYWSPKGRFVVVATVHSQQSFDMDFWDLDFEGEKTDADKDLTANLQLMNTADHYGVTDIDWDPTGRYVASSTTIWKHAMENGYHLYDFKGVLLREEHIERFKQWLWRPRPPSLLSKDEQKQVRKNLREFSRAFEEEDQFELDTANMEVVETRRSQFQEWQEWRQDEAEMLSTERSGLGLPATIAEMFASKRAEHGGEDAVVEEIIEDVVEETEEIVS
ncbi:MAG: Translation initiation factor 3 subunit b [Vezdaea aestivalis]|nr:MAG: Translation initiation factor 3 subunit b [Vezdaea aestivalis]